MHDNVTGCSVDTRGRKDSKGKRLAVRISQQRWMILMTLPAVLVVFVFNYMPLYGIIIAFKNYKPALGIWGSQWVGFRYFEQFFNNAFAWRTIRNTLILSLYSFVFGFPAPIILALLLNEIKNQRYKKLVQTISYLPHFISTVILVGLVKNVLALDGIVNRMIILTGNKPVLFMSSPEWFRTIYIVSGLWQSVGWGTIIYLAALSGVSPELYEAAIIDGANRWQQMKSVTLPSIMPTVVVLMILNVQGILNSDTQKILLMYNPNTYETADVIGTYVYREGIESSRYAYSAAVGLLTSAVSLILVVTVNKISKSVSEYSLW
ncbi:MAG: ABC transporter permease [Candidatus Fimadaptatus sp.]